MASRNFSTSSNYSDDVLHKREEARRKHLSLLQKCQRIPFHSVVIDEPVTENLNNNSTNITQQPYATNIPSTAGHSQCCQQNHISAHANHCPINHAMLNSPGYRRRFSVTSYQLLHTGTPRAFLPTSSYYLQHMGVGLPQVSLGTEKRQVTNTHNSQGSTDYNDDDVFQPLNVSNDISISNQTDLLSEVQIPSRMVRLQQLQARKRARSAGDMIGLSIPSSPGYTFSQQPTSRTENVARLQHHVNPAGLVYPLNGAPTHQPPPPKRPTTNTSHMHQNHQMPHMNNVLHPHSAHNHSINKVSTLSSMSYSSHTQNRGKSIPFKAEAENVRTATLSFEGVTSHSSFAGNVQQIEDKSPLPLSVQHATEKVVNTNKTNLKKSSLSSKPHHRTKKKVIWNDWTTEKRSKTDNDIFQDRSFVDVNVEAVRVNPSKFTSNQSIGPYLIGPKLGNSPVKSISQYLVRKANTNKYYGAKILNMDCGDVKSGRMLLHTEHSLLSLLSSHHGVIHQHGMFKDCCFDLSTGKISVRVGLILDCLTPHEFNRATLSYLNLQQYVVQAKRLREHEAIRIFYSIVCVVHSLHERNVVHRDLKLSNMVLDKRTRRVTLTNFCLGCHLASEKDLLTDQRGSPAYISPEILSDKPYLGKPSDMWSLGVVLFTMLYSHFPFYDLEPKQLYAKIKAADYTIPSDCQVSSNVNDILRDLLTANPSQRLTSAATLVALQACAASWHVLRAPSSAQVVPDIDVTSDSICKPPEEKPTENSFASLHEKEMTMVFQRNMLSDDEDDKGTGLVQPTIERQRSIPSVLHRLPRTCNANQHTDELVIRS